jgi:putative PEP-CTERM system histidine kinase
MDSKMAMVAAWSYGLAGVFAAFLTLYLASGWRAGGRSRAMFVAVGLCALWGMLALAFVLTGQAIFLAGSLLADVLRFGGWYFFLLLLIKPESSQANRSQGRCRWLGGIAVVLFLAGFTAQVLTLLGLDFVVPSQRLALFASLSMSVFGLVLIEQLFRNVSPDFRWSIKPLCLGLGGVFLFDLYLYSDALLFNRIDSDAFSIRGFAHALGLPLVALSAIRSHDWKRRLVMSQRAVMQSATLVIVGAYLLFMASAGYYVRFFGGEWGRALQLALLFAALLVLVGLTFSGAGWQTFFQLPLRLPRGMAAIHTDPLIARRLQRHGTARRAWPGGYGRESQRRVVVEGPLGMFLCAGGGLEHARFAGDRGCGEPLVHIPARQRLGHQPGRVSISAASL